MSDTPDTSDSIHTHTDWATISRIPDSGYSVLHIYPGYQIGTYILGANGSTQMGIHNIQRTDWYGR